MGAAKPQHSLAAALELRHKAPSNEHVLSNGQVMDATSRALRVRVATLGAVMNLQGLHCSQGDLSDSRIQ